ncbi:MAG: fumarylacetoacetate hydrolase family protein [Sphingomonadales bacterium]|nr:fumarylacetoacetate hydrolase family protein [Sphingomonadales bacterium]
MKIFAFDDSGRSRLGVMTSDTHFVALADVAPEFPDSLIAILDNDNGLDRVEQAVAGVIGDRALADVRRIAFLDRPNAIWALGLNFKTHIRETGLTTSDKYPHAFLRTAASLVGADEPLRAPSEDVARAYDYEGELGVVIGKPGRFIPKEHALSHVAGYTCVNEGSVREYQVHNRQFALGKNFEASGSYGPWLVTPDAFGDPASHTLITRLNGIVRQRSKLDDMLFDVAAVISYLSEGYTLNPGDLIAMGTPGVLKPQPGDKEGNDLDRQFGLFKIPGLVHMRPGDVVEVEIDGIGTLTNKVVGDQPRAYRAG